MILSINHRISNKQLSNYALNQVPRHSNLVVVNIKKYIKNVGSDEIKLIDWCSGPFYYSKRQNITVFLTGFLRPIYTCTSYLSESRERPRNEFTRLFLSSLRKRDVTRVAFALVWLQLFEVTRCHRNRKVYACNQTTYRKIPISHGAYFWSKGLFAKFCWGASYTWTNIFAFWKRYFCSSSCNILRFSVHILSLLLTFLLFIQFNNVLTTVSTTIKYLLLKFNVMFKFNKFQI